MASARPTIHSASRLFSPRRIGPIGDLGTQPTIVTLIMLVVTIVVGAAIAVSPMLAFGAAVVISMAGTLLLTSSARQVFLVSLAILLAGYALLGRGLAHVGVAPVYLGELVLLVGVVALVASLGRVRFEPTILVLVAFMIWGALRTIPYIGEYGIDAARDAASWGYGVFAIVVWLVIQPRHLDPLVRAYRAFIPVLLVWIPIAAFVTITFADAIPSAPGSDVPLIVFKPGDFAVHLAAVAAFVLTGLYWRTTTLGRQLFEVGLWTAWVVAVGLAGALSRGAMAAAGMAGVALLFTRSYSPLVRATFALLFLGALIGLANPVVDLGAGARKFSVDQIVANFDSILSDDDPGTDLAATKEWRARWWATIIDYTFQGPYFWTGKGYGVNLANDDGFQVLDDNSLRSPHNGHLQFLARGGVPGLALWAILQGAFAITVVSAIRRAGRLHATVERGILITVLVYWLAALANAAADVYIEGPQGGILFWSVMGLGLGIAAHLRRSERGIQTDDHVRVVVGTGARTLNDHPASATLAP